MKAKAYAAGTILNALATGIGAAFGVDLKLEVDLVICDDLKQSVVVSKGAEFRSALVDEICGIFGLNAKVFVESEIPQGSGLGSSSALANALIVAICKAKKIRLSDEEILKINAKASLKAGVSYTGALDDAAASLLGDFLVTDNYKMKILKRWHFEGYSTVLIPRFKRGKIDFDLLRSRGEELRNAVKFALDGNFYDAMVENTKFYCRFIGYPVEIAELGWKRGICCGLSGNGPSYCGFGSKSEMEELAEIWKDFGEVIVRKLPSKPAND
ncbi:MAG: shikimate kinase [Archaeoglobales archaeon]|nr:shikimate kinase [Archaeoglobales archaeon]